MKEIAALSGIRANECGGCFLEDYGLICIGVLVIGLIANLIRGKYGQAWFGR